MLFAKVGIKSCRGAREYVSFVHVSVLQPGRVKWVTFSPGHTGRRVKLKLSGFIILSNIAVTNNTSDCSIREY